VALGLGKYEPDKLGAMSIKSHSMPVFDIRLIP